MKKTLRTIFMAALLLMGASSAHATTTLVDSGDWKVLLGGFVETDLINDSTRSFTEEPDNNPVARRGTLAGDNGRTQMSMRNSRIAFTVVPPSVEGWRTKGYMEMDFLGYDPAPATTAGVTNQSEANFFTKPTLRLRHAYFSSEKDTWQILVGQYWTLFGYDPIYVLNTVTVAPVSGTVYERTPQVLVVKNWELGNQAILQTAANLSRPTQRDGSVPNFDFGLRGIFGSRKSGFTNATGMQKIDPMSLAVSGTVRNYNTPVVGGAVGQNQSYTGGAIAINGMLPIIASDDGKDAAGTLSLAGEFTTGSGYGDQFTAYSGLPSNPSVASTTAFPFASAAATAAGINIDQSIGGYDAGGTFHLINLQTWNVQGQYYLPKAMNNFFTGTTWISAGYGQLYSNNIQQINLTTAGAAIAAGAYFDRSQTAFINIMHDFTPRIRVALEYANFMTHYDNFGGNAGVAPGNEWNYNNRFQASAYFYF